MIYPYFNIGIASDIIGIAPETIRHYERKDILKPSVQGSNRYRQYIMPDICVLARARAYREYGFSLEHANKMMSEENIDFTVQSLQTRANELESTIFKELALLGNIKRKIADIAQVQADVGKFSMRNRPALRGVHTFCNGAPDIESIKVAKVSEWYSNQTITFTYWSFDGTRFENLDVEDFDIYMGILESDTTTTDLKAEQGVVHHPSRACLHTATISCIDDDRRKTFEPIVEYLHKNHMHVNGEVIWQTISGHTYGESCMYYRNLWIPLI